MHANQQLCHTLPSSHFLSSALESINQGCARMAGWDPGTLLLPSWMMQTQGLVLWLESSFSTVPNVTSTGTNTSHSYSYALPAFKIGREKKRTFVPTISIFHITTNQTPILFSSGRFFQGVPMLNLWISSQFFILPSFLGGREWACWHLKTDGLPGMWSPRNTKLLICWL